MKETTGVSKTGKYYDNNTTNASGGKDHPPSGGFAPMPGRRHLAETSAGRRPVRRLFQVGRNHPKRAKGPPSNVTHSVVLLLCRPHLRFAGNSASCSA